MKVIDIVRDDAKVHFLYLSPDRELWYRADNGFEFPIPLEDTKGAMFKAEDKALFFMRWIRKHLAMLDESKYK